MGRLVMSRIGALVMGLVMVGGVGQMAWGCYDEEEAKTYEEEFHPKFDSVIDMAGSAMYEGSQSSSLGTMTAAGVVLSGSVVVLAKQAWQGRR